MIAVPATGEASRGRSPLGAAWLPGLWDASAIELMPRIQPMSLIEPNG